MTNFGAEFCHSNDNRQVQSFIQLAPSRSWQTYIGWLLEKAGNGPSLAVNSVGPSPLRASVTRVTSA